MSDFAENLRLLCTFYDSISEVCRRIGVNRQQFNKYLAGNSIPSARNLRRICRFFGIDEADIRLPYSRFRRVVEANPGRGIDKDNTILKEISDTLSLGSQGLDAYQGYYFRYFLTDITPHRIVKCLFVITRTKDGFYTKCIGSSQMDLNGYRRPLKHLYLGVPMLTGGTLSIMERDELYRQIILCTFVYGTYRNHLDVLVGLQSTFAGSRARMPSAGNVVFEYLGTSINVRKALKSCGLFAWSDDEVAPWIKDWLRRQKVDDFVLTVPEP